MNPISTYPLGKHNTLGLNVACQQLVIANDEQSLINACTQSYRAKQPLLLIGGGSNLVLTETFAGKVVLVATKGIGVSQDDKHYFLSVAAGENWHQLVEYCLKHQMPGLENLALIPGSVGAAPIQNIGAYGAELAHFCQWVEYWDLKTEQLNRLNLAQCHFGYRDSIFKQQLQDRALILRVGLKLPKAWHPNLTYGPLQSLAEADLPPTPQAIFDCICAARREKLPDPAILGNVGSFFKNPVIANHEFIRLKQQYANIVGYPHGHDHMKLAAAWLIEQAGLKGYTIGGASVHLKQALVIVNNGNCTGEDICQLAKHIVAKIYQDFHITLEIEPRIIGAYGQKDIFHA